MERLVRSALVLSVLALLAVLLVSLLFPPPPQAVFASLNDAEPDISVSASSFRFNSSDDAYSFTFYISDEEGVLVSRTVDFQKLEDKSKRLNVYFELNGSLISQCSYASLIIPQNMSSYSFQCKLPEADADEEWKDDVWRMGKRLRMKGGGFTR